MTGGSPGTALFFLPGWKSRMQPWYSAFKLFLTACRKQKMLTCSRTNWFGRGSVSMKTETCHYRVLADTTYMHIPKLLLCSLKDKTTSPNVITLWWRWFYEDRIDHNEDILTHLPRILPTFLILASKMSSTLIYLKKIHLLWLKIHRL